MGRNRQGVEETGEGVGGAVDGRVDGEEAR